MSRQRSVLGRLTAATAAALLYLPLAAGYGHQYGSLTQFLNTYFLPATAQVSGLSGLIFGVILPFAIVMVLLYIGLDRVIGGREAVALSVLLSLFVIPSGGYRLISAFFLALFGLGNTTPGAPTLQSTLGLEVASTPLLASLVVVIGLTALFHLTRERFGGWEYLVVVGAGIATYFLFGGSLQIVWTMIGYGIIFFMGMEIFERGMGTNRISGSIVGLMGIAIVALSVSTISVLPGSVRNIAGLLGGVGIVVMAALILFLLGAIIIIIHGILDGWLLDHI